MVQMGDIIYVLNELGFGIEVVSDEEFLKSMKEMMMDDSKSMLVSSLISYSSSDTADNIVRAEAILLKDFKDGKLGKITLEK